jgi:5-methylcytosine-specific restriction endonuclease McrA
VSVPCAFCGKPVVTIPSRVKWSQIRGRGKVFCDKECQRRGNSEEGHPCWKEDRQQIRGPRSTRTLQYRQWRTAVFERDRYTCQKCGKVGGYLHAHHIKEWEYYPELRYEVSNGTTLCRVPCHREVHGARRTNRKMSDAQVMEAKALRDEGRTLCEVGREFGVSESTISTICSGKKRTKQLP